MYVNAVLQCFMETGSAFDGFYIQVSGPRFLSVFSRMQLNIGMFPSEYVIHGSITSMISVKLTSINDFGPHAIISVFSRL